MLVTDTLVSRSLGATPPKFRAHAPTIAAPVIWNTKMIPSFVASSEPPLIVTPTLEVSVTATVEATLPTVTPSEPQG